MLVLVVTKKVRERSISLPSALRTGFDILQGLKPTPLRRIIGTSKLVP